MPAHFSKFFLAGLGLAFLPLASAQAGTSPEGVWLNDTGRGAIEIKQCGDKLCGHVVWLRDETDVKGCGRQIIGEARKVGSKSWDGGWIYSPEKKRKYDVELTPLESGKLRVKGYAGSKLFSRTMIWSPAPADLKRCGDGTTSAEAAKTAPAPAPSTATTAATSPEPQAPVIVNAKPAAGSKSPDVAKAPEPAPAETAKTETTATPAPEEKGGAVAATEPEAPATAPEEAGAANEDVASDEGDEAGNESGDKIGGLLDRLAELERETGYGLKKSGEGRCRLKVPFATVDIPCDK